jgi:hypothetical protein
MTTLINKTTADDVMSSQPTRSFWREAGADGRPEGLDLLGRLGLLGSGDRSVADELARLALGPTSPGRGPETGLFARSAHRVVGDGAAR